MSALSVWFLLVFVPNLYKPLIFLGVCSGVVAFIGAVLILNSRIESRYDLSEDRKYLEEKPETTWLKERIAEREQHNAWLDRSEVVGFRWVKVAIGAILTMSLVGAGVPDKKEIAAIVLIPYISNNPEFQKLPESLAKRLNDLLKSYEPDVKDLKEVTND